MQRLVGWNRIPALAGIAIASSALTLGIVELVGRFFLTPMLVRYSENQAFKLQLANPKDLGIASLYVPHHYYLFLHFFWQQKLWWLIPMIVVLLFFGILMIIAQGSAIAPFIYALF